MADSRGGCRYTVRLARGALGGIVVGACGFLYDFHFKAYGLSFGREALGIVAGLKAENAVHHVFAGLHRVQGMDRHSDREIAAIDV